MCKKSSYLLCLVVSVIYLASPPHAALALQLSNPLLSTLEDEKAAYTKWGWAWTASQEPKAPTGPFYVSHIDVHGDLEADDLWQNIVMWQRTGQQGYYDLAAAWADYYKNRYRGDYQDDLNAHFGCHTFGWGLIEWARITGDSSYLAAANQIGDDLQTQWYGSYGESIKAGFYGLRGPGRQLKMAVALGRATLANDMWEKLRASFMWDERTVNGTAIGFWKVDSSAFPWATGATGAMSTFEFAVLFDGIYDYYQMTGNVEAKRRLILMSRFAQQFGMDPTVNHTGHFIIVDYPAKGAFFHTGVGPNEALDPFYTCTLIDVLVRGYLLTGDVALLDRAKYTWDRSSKAKESDPYPYTTRVADNQVGHFVNSRFLSNLFYVSDGEITYAGTLFKAAISSTTPAPTTGTGVTESWKLLPNSSLRSVLASTPYIKSPGPDGWSYPPDNMIHSWSGGIVDTKRKLLILPAVGGHTSWFYNDVWAYDVVNQKWLNLRQSYLPYITQSDADLGSNRYFYPDGSPPTVHTYDGIAYLENLDEVFMIGGPGWGGSGQGPAPRRFSMTTHNWSFGTSQGIYPENGTCSAVNPADGKVWVRSSYRLHAYDVASDTYTLLADGMPDRGAYSTCVILNGAFYKFGSGSVTKFVPGQAEQAVTVGGDGPPPAPAPGMVWEPAMSRFVGWGGGRDIYLIDPVTMTAVKRTITGDDPGVAEPLGTYKRFGRVGPGQYVLMNTLDGVFLLTLDVGIVPTIPTTGSTTPVVPPPAPTPTPTPTPPVTVTTLLVPGTMNADQMATKANGAAYGSGSWILFSEGDLENAAAFPTSGTYRFTVTAFGQVAAGVWPDLEVLVDQQRIGKVNVNKPTASPFVFDASIGAGTHTIALAFTNDYYAGGEDRNLILVKLAISPVIVVKLTIAPASATSTTTPPTATGK